MAKPRQFEVQDDYLANHGGRDRGETTKTPVTVSNYSALKQKIESYIQLDKDAELISLLKSDFIYPQMIRVYTLTTFNSFGESGTGQRNKVTYEIYNVTPVLEELLTNHKEDLIHFCRFASPKCKVALMDFTNLDFLNVMYRT